jgi:hypothetical protein
MTRTTTNTVFTTDSFSAAYEYMQKFFTSTGMTDLAAANAAEGMITEAEQYGWDGVKAVKIEFDNVTYTITSKV